VLLFAIPVLYAGTCDATEIEHLIEYVEQSGCSFIRNGSKADAHAAAASTHEIPLRSRPVKTAEQFIQRIAGQSSITGQR